MCGVHFRKPISLFGDVGTLRTSVLISRTNYRLAQDTTVPKLIACSKVSHPINALCYPQYWAHMPLPPTYNARDWIYMEFIAHLPESTKAVYTGILVLVIRWTLMAILLPCQQDIDSPELVFVLFQHAICKRSIPTFIRTNCGTQFTYRLRIWVCSHIGWSIDRALPSNCRPMARPSCRIWP